MMEYIKSGRFLQGLDEDAEDDWKGIGRIGRAESYSQSPRKS